MSSGDHIGRALAEVERIFPFDGYISRSVDSYRLIAETALRYLKPRSTILDFGCGPGDKTALLQFLGFRCSGYDDLGDHWHTIDDNIGTILSFYKDTGIDFRLSEDGRGLPWSAGHFDMIMLHNVLEHLHDPPRNLLNELIPLLRTDGLLFVTVPNAANIRKRIHLLVGKTNMPRYETYYWYRGPWRGHIREYVRGDLVSLAGFLSLEVIELRGCHLMLRAIDPRLRSVFRLASYPFDGWKDSWMMVARKPQDWTPRRKIDSNEYAHLMKRIVSYSYKRYNTQGRSK